MAILYLVATPIGNLEDISARAVRILQEVRMIAAEDTRQTGKLLKRYEITTPMISYHEHNKQARGDDILLALVQGDDVALVSDAGTPAISDPGYELVESIIAAGIEVQGIPGPCAAISGLIVSGLPTDRFCFAGFAPRKQQERQAWLSELQDLTMTLVLYEAPHRILKTLQDIANVLGNRPAAAARELTKLHEQVVRGTVQSLIQYFEQQAPRGEFVLIIGGATKAAKAKRRQLLDATTEPIEVPEADQAETVTPDQVQTRLRELRDTGMNGTKAAKQVAREWGLERQDVYRLWTELD